MFDLVDSLACGAPGTDAAASPPHRLRDLNARFAPQDAPAVLHHARQHLGQVALVSSFGAEAAVLLHMAAMVDRDFPVLFIDTGRLFAQTLAYQRQLGQRLGLRDLRVVRADDIARHDPDATLHARDGRACCELRKSAPLRAALAGFDGWISGRKRFHAGQRADLPLFEAEPGTARIKVNPLAFWSARDIRAYMQRHDLPPHPLVSRGFASIGCLPCTTRVEAHEDPRAGRWRDSDRQECGIHLPDPQPVNIR